MARTKLTAGRIREFDLPEGKSQVFLWDSEVKELAVRATAGQKAYVFQSLFAGSSLRMTLGNVDTWDIPQAREEARRLQTLVDKGIDPRQAKQEAIAASKAQKDTTERAKITLGEVWPRYIDARKGKWGERSTKDHINIARRGGEQKARTIGITVDAPLVPLLDVKMSDLTDECIATWLEKETATRATSASLAFRLLRGCLNWCEGEKDLAGLVPAGALQATKVRDAIPQKTSKDDCLQREQLALWFSHVEQIGNQVQSAYLQILLLTGARREELLGVKWADVGFQWKSITIKDKVDGERVIPLTPFVAALMESLPRRNEWVFSSPAAESGRLQEPRIAHNKALAAAGLPALSLHGLRRSFGTLAEWVECPVGIVAQIMGHKPSALAEKHYRKRPLDLLRMWHIKIEEWILKEAGVGVQKENHIIDINVIGG